MKIKEAEVKEPGWKDFFPYEPRLNQNEIAEFLTSNFNHRNIAIVEAPYGIGKSITINGEPQRGWFSS